MMLSFRSGLLALTAVLTMVPAQALTVIDVSGPNDNSLTATPLFYNPTVGFALASDYTNVSITVSLYQSGGTDGWNLEAFLTRQIGPGTTAASHEEASTAQLVNVPMTPLSPPFTVTPVTLFTNLTLAAGNYYIVLGGTFAGFGTTWWVGNNGGNAVTSTSGGASVTDPGLYVGGLTDTYAPASEFSPVQAGFANWFTVTGDPAQTGVPEPSSIALTLLGGLVLLHLRRGTPRHQ